MQPAMALHCPSTDTPAATAGAHNTAGSGRTLSGASGTRWRRSTRAWRTWTRRTASCVRPSTSWTARWVVRWRLGGLVGWLVVWPGARAGGRLGGRESPGCGVGCEEGKKSAGGQPLAREGGEGTDCLFVAVALRWRLPDARMERRHALLARTTRGTSSLVVNDQAGGALQVGRSGSQAPGAPPAPSGWLHAPGPSRMVCLHPVCRSRS